MGDRSVIVIGGGIAGLATGIYARTRGSAGAEPGSLAVAWRSEGEGARPHPGRCRAAFAGPRAARPPTRERDRP